MRAVSQLCFVNKGWTFVQNPEVRSTFKGRIFVGSKVSGSAIF